MSFQSFGALMGSRPAGSLRSAGPPAMVAGVAVAAWLGYHRERRTCAHSHDREGDPA
jgi:hypothetical protein